MKKIIFTLTVVTSLSLSAQKKNKDILNSKNIKEIESFLKTAHPDDGRRTVLKSKLIALKNAAWMKPDQQKAFNLKPSYIEIPKAVMQQKDNNEVEEFKKLLSENSKKHEEKTVKLLNQLFENDVTNKEAILLMQNNSDCNMIVRIQGKEFYNLAVPAHGENSVVIKKGDYQLRSNVCDAFYTSTKSIAKNMLVILNKPVVNFLSTTYAQNKNGASY
ncbi:DUF6759 domain-containing protein [Kaistella jeonii]|uniref:DUF6759 domain-containing protein n=1 Tax=Kaistella jeonii TaxID=266749 RepID=A0A0C1D760_9FLAO|nr:DUF6759 domain-containing protein [Kaistella jeonii]KIA89725.1 hypothetical protein OA86_03620 [Kaistella jeonii]SFB87665.1 hypothetical protein SAMN05421876_103171 [Kaistella jeonii]VEI95951.1 Uncharacterised protein [Kaistella jeonii]